MKISRRGFIGTALGAVAVAFVKIPELPAPADASVANQAYLNFVIKAENGVVPAGSITPFVAGGPIPKGWVLCDGRVLNCGEYKQLHSVIGTTYGKHAGGFRVPDMRGRMVS